MGGVRTNEAPCTLPSTLEVVNRFSSATMNQLYCPQKTADFFAFLKRSKVKAFVVTNNAVEDLTTLKSRASREDVVEAFLCVNELNSPFLGQIATNHYKCANVKVKPYDYYAAIALHAVYKAQNKAPDSFAKWGKGRFCYHSNVYGIACVNRRSTWAAAREEYVKVLGRELDKITEEGEAPAALRKSYREEIRQTKALNWMGSLVLRELAPRCDQSLRLDPASLDAAGASSTPQADDADEGEGQDEAADLDSGV
jgi:hypothetical protein